MAAAQTEHEVPKSMLCPKFLHSNSTSHTGPFSAIAELIDNAYDTDVNAKQIWIDKTQIKDIECLTFMDNGNGLNYKSMHRMLSFGYSNKKVVNGKDPIGIYGNGFKSGSMHLGQDVIVLSKSKNDLCVGMLSQTYLERTGAEEINVPIISIKKPEAKHFSVMEEHQASLRDILDHSPFNTEEELLTELRAIESSCSSTGTRIIIWNLRRTSSGKPAIDFITDRYDIRIPCDDLDSSDPDSKYSLRAYCSVLYMKPRMQINIRGQKVKTQLISKSLAHIAKDFYKPSYVKKRIPIIFGYNTKSKEHYGLMMYHKNRLIKAYHRVGCQKDANNNRGIGVIGVIECDFLDPTHNKQDFVYTENFRNTIRNVATKLEEYWRQIRFKRKNSNRSNNVPIEEEEKRPDQNWAQCDKCQKWRRMPDGINNDKLPEEWFCYMNPDPQFRRCETMEEQEDPDSEQPANPKTYKIQEKDKKKHEKIKEFKKTSTLKKTRTPKEGASASGVSTSSSHPAVLGLKRLQPTTPQNESKRPKLDGPKRKLVTDMSPSSSTTPPTPVPHKDLNIDDNLLEGSSTPAPTEPTLHPVGVRTESDPMDSAYVAFTSPWNSYVDEPTVNYIIPQMRDEEEMRDKSIQIWDADEEDEEEIWDEIIEISDEEEEDEEMRGKSTQMRDEEEEEREEMRDKSTKMQGPRVKDEEEMNSSTAANDGAKVMEEGMISIIQAQEEQDQLMELLQSVFNERDSFKEKVGELHAQLELKKQCAEKLSREKEDLTRRLDQSRNELWKLHLKVKQLEEEKATTAGEPRDHGRV
ncbi:MORC family CW-type zinc finger protein 3 isoform X4 [Gadus morhua]|uniref:MORC family CW-type zinc finger protein 3 isoform X4 n=1 Tax=Gadus morhua TaxID=8049 RepID=UPI0011B8189C|nr:MORC family CW-type zinc finger protein 3-like isoform X4 [Gadus morhua]